MDQPQGGVDVEVTDHRQDGVARCVVLVEEVLGVVEARRLKLVEVAVAVVGVGERVEGDRRERDPGKPAVGPVQHVHPNLLLDHRDLVVQVLPGDPGRAHPVGLEEQRAFQPARGQQLVVVGVVRMCGSVEYAPGGLHVLRVFGLSDIFTALKHKMFKQVREAGPSLRLGAESHVIVDSHGDDGRRAIRSQHDAQPVRQGGLLHRVGGRRQQDGGRIRLGTRGHGWQRYCGRACHGPGTR